VCHLNNQRTSQFARDGRTRFVAEHDDDEQLILSILLHAALCNIIVEIGICTLQDVMTLTELRQGTCVAQ
jgi:hypothetical protein